MKHLFCLLICFCMVLFAGCGFVASPDPVKTLCQAEVITFTNGQWICSMKRVAEGFEIRFATPETIAPLVLTYDGKVLHAAYDGLETDVPHGFAGGVMPLFDAVRVFETNESRQKSENIRMITLDETEFLLYYDKKSGMPTRLETKGADGVFGFDILSCIENDDDTESSCSDTSQ